MPARNAVKIYLKDAFYHIYNRGVEGRSIFCDDQDYRIFLSYIKRYLTRITRNEVPPRWRSDVVDKLQLVSYCLMPNHFHLLVKQKTSDGMTIFMKALMNSYVRYFNQKYKRVGGLFQGVFKAVEIAEETYLLHLTRYIHLNPLDLEGINFSRLEDYFCSYGEYIGKRNTSWIHTKEIISMFGSKLAGIESFSSYKDFVNKYQGSSGEILEKLILE
jgi:putative transposase